MNLSFDAPLEARRQATIIVGVTITMAMVGLFAEDLVAYLCIAVPAIIPFILWIRAGAAGIPLLPLISVMFLMYYALPLLRSDIAAYGPDELVRAGATVGGFLLAAALTAWPFMTRRPTRRPSRNFVSDTHIIQLINIGLGGGIVYHLALISGNLAWLGSTVGAFRSVVLTLTSVACYFLGYARASGILAGPPWAIAVAMMGLLIALAASNLIIVGAAMYGLAALFGFVVTGKRIPWIVMGLAFTMLSILHAGKYEMREKYWEAHSQSLQESSLSQVPDMIVDWVTMGVSALASGTRESNVLERASLLHMVLLVQRGTPDFIPYLEGQTYAMLPDMLVPRFVDESKINSQAVLNFLSVRYGLQNIESTANTTIGWGLVAEAYANFGYLGVAAIGALFGLLCGVLMRLSNGAAPLSLPMFVTIAATMTILNVELDLSYLMVTLAQTLAAVVLLAGLPKLLRGRNRRALAEDAAPFGAGEPPFTDPLPR